MKSHEAVDPMVAQGFRYSDNLAVKRKFTIGTTQLEVASFNVLFPKWLTMNVGLKHDGSIGKFLPSLASMKPELRKLGIIFTIIELLRTVDVLGIQEFDLTHMPELDLALKHIGNYGVIVPGELTGYEAAEEARLTKCDHNDLQVIIYNKEVLSYSPAKSRLTYYQESSFFGRTRRFNTRVMDVLFTIGGVEFRFINTHVLFGAMDQLVSYVNGITKSDSQKSLLIIVVGDMNQESRPDGFAGSPNDPELMVYIGMDKYENLPYTSIDNQGRHILTDHIWYKEI